MSILSGLFGFLQNLFSGLLDFLSDNLLLIILILVAIYFLAPVLWETIATWVSELAIWPAIAAVWGWLSGFSLVDVLVGSLVIWFLTDPEGVVQFVADSVGTIVGAVASGLSEGLGLPTLFTIGIGLYFFMNRKKKDREDGGTTNESV
jgi:hypothetical protein